MFGLSTEKVDCPYCGEQFEAVIDCSEAQQSYVEDCWVCCRPIIFQVSVDDTGLVTVSTHHENEC